MDIDLRDEFSQLVNNETAELSAFHAHREKITAVNLEADNEAAAEAAALAADSENSLLTSRLAELENDPALLPALTALEQKEQDLDDTHEPNNDDMFAALAKSVEVARHQIGKAQQGLSKTNTGFTESDAIASSDGDDDNETRQSRTFQDLMVQQQQSEQAIRMQQDMQRFENKLDNLDSAIDRALAQAKSEQERQEILEYQALVKQAREEISNEDLSDEQREKLRKKWDKKLDQKMPDSVKQQLQKEQEPELDEATKLSNAEKSAWGATDSISAADSINPTPIESGISLTPTFSLATALQEGTDTTPKPVSPETAPPNLTNLG